VIAIVTLAALVLALAAVAFVLLATIGASREPGCVLPVRAHGRLTRLARRILGLYIRRPSADVPELRREASSRR